MHFMLYGLLQARHSIPVSIRGNNQLLLCLAEHCRRPGPPSGGELGHGHQPIAGERRVDNLVRGYRYARPRRPDQEGFGG